MTNEATLIIETGPPISFTVDNTAGIEKGTVLGLQDPRTVSGSTTSNEAVGGIAASEKIASDGKTVLGVYRQGVFKVTLSGSATAGESLMIEGISNLNYVQLTPPGSAGATISGAHIMGTALESGTTGETILMELNPVTVIFDA